KAALLFRIAFFGGADPSALQHDDRAVRVGFVEVRGYRDAAREGEQRREEQRRHASRNASAAAVPTPNSSVAPFLEGQSGAEDTIRTACASRRASGGSESASRARRPPRRTRPGDCAAWW